MSDGSVHTDGDDFNAIAAELQNQIDSLTSTLEMHQRLFERLRAQGLLTADGEPNQS